MIEKFLPGRNICSVSKDKETIDKNGDYIEK
jgi:hypothetical protein